MIIDRLGFSEPMQVKSVICAPQFYQRLWWHLQDRMRICAYEGAEIAVFQWDDGMWRCGPDFLLYSAPFNYRPMRLGAFMREFAERQQQSILTWELDWQAPHGFRADECWLTPAVAFTLPTTWDEYLASLNKKRRYEIRAVDAELQAFTAHHELPSRTIMDELFEVYKERMLTRFDMDEGQVSDQMVTVQAFIDTANEIGTLFPLTIYDGLNVVGVNIAELVNGRVLDILSVWYPRYSECGKVGKFIINRNIERAIATQAAMYDIGIVEPDMDSYVYKLGWVPKAAALPMVYHYAVVYGRDVDEGIYPPYYLMDQQALVC